MGPDDGATGGTGVTSQAAVAACAGMALFYVAILYAPMLVLRLPPPTSVESFLIRRFVCAIVSSIASVVLSSALLGVRSFEHISTIFNIHGIRGDHMVTMLLLLSFLGCYSYGNRKFLNFVDGFLFVTLIVASRDIPCSANFSSIHGNLCIKVITYGANMDEWEIWL